MLLISSFSHLGVTDVVDEYPIFSNLLGGHLLLFPSTCLIVVQQCDEALVSGATQCFIFHPREEWVFCFIVTPVSLGTCNAVCVHSFTFKSGLTVNFAKGLAIKVSILILIIDIRDVCVSNTIYDFISLYSQNLRDMVV